MLGDEDPEAAVRAALRHALRRPLPCDEQGGGEELRIADVQLTGRHAAHGLTRGVNTRPVYGIARDHVVEQRLDRFQLRRGAEAVAREVDAAVNLGGEHIARVLRLPLRSCEADGAAALRERQQRVRTAGTGVVDEQHERERTLRPGGT